MPEPMSAGPSRSAVCSPSSLSLRPAIDRSPGRDC
jgi:hypothetical protein